MANRPSNKEEISSAQAVLLGALAPGVNGPTWNTLRTTFLMLGLCLSVMLGLAFSSSDAFLVLHIAFLVLITAILFFLLSWFLAQTGLVSVEHQMREMDLMPNDGSERTEQPFRQTWKAKLERELLQFLHRFMDFSHILSLRFGILLLVFALFALNETEARAAR